MPTILITGANRGIGLEFARQYAADGWRVIAAARRPGEAEELKQLGVEVEQLDAAEGASIHALADRLKGRAIDVLIANAGVLPRGVDTAEWTKAFATNCIGPTLLAKAFKAHMAAGGKMIAITSKMGSIADNESGGAIAYRSSKAALNAAWRSLSIDWRGDDIALAMLHPGWVQTDMGGAGAAIDPTTSVSGMPATIAGLTRDRTGSFLNYDGQELPW
ncbi:putative oxidoreductase [Sphingomonas changbaiensis NBRC 104936]|uniref:Putative oxidoreductase n=1 Tax=Sphingomonas changbaiensis NBRC 104936 TaxID=1219043 RepID=A0A0E9MR78_9SPHN|nr:SDR family oxidoreductase [Sphingomonas changbaiensis]GAO39978.1 putative oxidoreductase [Sphingomonas changbaiensis NBRC 104936]